MAIKTYRDLTHEEWLKMRNDGFGSSEIAHCCNLSKYGSPLKFYHAKRAAMQGEPQEFESMITKFGHWLEPSVASAFEECTGHKVIKSTSGDFIVKNDLRPYLQASPDRYYWIDENGKHNEANKGILECKTTNLSLEDEKEDLVPIKGYNTIVDNNALVAEEKTLYIPISWYCQVQYQLLVCNKKHAALAYMRLMSRDFGYCYIDFDEDFCNGMLHDADEMWECIQNGVEPKITTIEDANDKWPGHIDGTAKEADMEISTTIGRIKELDAQIKPLEKQRKQYTDSIKMYFEDFESLTIGGEIAATYRKAADKMVLNDKRLQLEAPEIYEKYLEPKAGSRMLRLK